MGIVNWVLNNLVPIFFGLNTALLACVFWVALLIYRHLILSQRQADSFHSQVKVGLSRLFLNNNLLGNEADPKDQEIDIEQEPVEQDEYELVYNKNRR